MTQTTTATLRSSFGSSRRGRVQSTGFVLGDFRQRHQLGEGGQDAWIGGWLDGVGDNGDDEALDPHRIDALALRAGDAPLELAGEERDNDFLGETGEETGADNVGQSLGQGHRTRALEFVVGHAGHGGDTDHTDLVGVKSPGERVFGLRLAVEDMDRVRVAQGENGVLDVGEVLGRAAVQSRQGVGVDGAAFLSDIADELVDRFEDRWSLGGSLVG